MNTPLYVPGRFFRPSQKCDFGSLILIHRTITSAIPSPLRAEGQGEGDTIPLQPVV
jgi:hypothetical protein